MESEGRAECPKANRMCENVVMVRQLERSGKRQSTRVIAVELNLDRKTVRKISTEDLEMRRISKKMVPAILTNEQK